MKPILGITMGDAAGIGPEVIIKALANQRIYELAHPVVIGDRKIIQRALPIVHSELKLRILNNLDNFVAEYGVIDILDLNNLPKICLLLKLIRVLEKQLMNILKRQLI